MLLAFVGIIWYTELKQRIGSTWKVQSAQDKKRGEDPSSSAQASLAMGSSNGGGADVEKGSR